MNAQPQSPSASVDPRRNKSRANLACVSFQTSGRTGAVTQIEQPRTTEAPGKVMYTAKTHTTGGRENGVSRSSDGRLDVKLSVPGSPRIGANPEQLFAAGWSACFESAIGLAARKRKVTLTEVVIDAEVDACCAPRQYPQLRQRHRDHE